MHSNGFAEAAAGFEDGAVQYFNLDTGAEGQQDVGVQCTVSAWDVPSGEFLDAGRDKEAFVETKLAALADGEYGQDGVVQESKKEYMVKEGVYEAAQVACDECVLADLKIELLECKVESLVRPEVLDACVQVSHREFLAQAEVDEALEWRPDCQQTPLGAHDDFSHGHAQSAMVSAYQLVEGQALTAKPRQKDFGHGKVYQNNKQVDAAQLVVCGSAFVTASRGPECAPGVLGQSACPSLGPSADR